jgi:hypothetical protein
MLQRLGALDAVAWHVICDHLSSAAPLYELDIPLILACAATSRHTLRLYEDVWMPLLLDGGWVPNEMQFRDEYDPAKCAACARYRMECNAVCLIRLYTSHQSAVPRLWSPFIMASLTYHSTPRAWRKVVGALCALDLKTCTVSENLGRAIALLQSAVEQHHRLHLPLLDMATEPRMTVYEALDTVQLYHESRWRFCQNVGTALRRIAFLGSTAAVVEGVSTHCFGETGASAADAAMDYIFERFREPGVEPMPFFECLDDGVHDDVKAQFVTYIGWDLERFLAVWCKKFDYIHMDLRDTDKIASVMSALVNKARRVCIPANSRDVTAFHVATLRVVMLWMTLLPRDAICFRTESAVARLLSVVPRINRDAAEPLTWVLDSLCDHLIKSARGPTIGWRAFIESKILTDFLPLYNHLTGQRDPYASPVARINGENWTLDELCARVSAYTPKELVNYNEYDSLFYVHFVQCASNCEETVHNVLRQLTKLVRAYGHLWPLERPMHAMLGTDAAQRYNALMAEFLSDIVLSVEGLRRACQCCGCPYLDSVTELGGIDRLVALTRENAQSLQHLQALAQLPAIESNLDVATDAEVAVEIDACDDYLYMDALMEQADDGVELGHFDDDDEEDDK